VWFLSEQKHTSDGLWPRGLAGFLGQRPYLSYIKSCSHKVAKHKSGVIYRFHLTVPPLVSTQKLQKNNFYFWNSACHVRHDVMPTEPRHHVDQSNNTHDVIEIPWWHWRNRGNPYTTYVVSDIFIPPPDTMARLPDSTGKIFLIYLRNISCWW
jgi:hypothetical protein